MNIGRWSLMRRSAAEVTYAEHRCVVPDRLSIWFHRMKAGAIVRCEAPRYDGKNRMEYAAIPICGQQWKLWVGPDGWFKEWRPA